MCNNCVLKQTKRFLRSAMKIREWEDKCIPTSQSRIAFDLFLLLAQSAADDKRISQKSLFASLPYSERGVRYVLKRFIAEGWCELEEDKTDKRLRFLAPTSLLKDALIEYHHLVLNEYCDSARSFD